MKRLVWLVDVSLDGFMSGPNEELDWLGANVDDEMWQDVFELLGTVDTALFGRLTYQNFEQYWPAVSGNPASTKYDLDFSRWIDATPKYVASTTLSNLQWKNSVLLGTDIRDSVSRLKKQSGKSILIFGSRELVLQLLDSSLIDEWRIRIHPVVLGVGRPLFRNGSERHNLKLIHSSAFASGVMNLRYEL